MARREMETGFPKDTFSLEFKHFQREMESPFEYSFGIGGRTVGVGVLMMLMSLTLNPGELTTEVQNLGVKIGETGLGIVIGGAALTKGLIPAVLAGIRMAAAESGVVEPYDPIARGCFDCLPSDSVK